MASPSPVFILCCERSGSTLLRYILDTHPDICCPGELYLGRLIKDLRVTVARTAALSAADKPEDQEKAAQREVQRILNELLSNFAGTRGKKIWCDKTPANLKNLSDIEWAFPDVRYICLHRNSWDVVQSCLELRRKGFIEWTAPYVARNPQNFVTAMLDSWIEKTQTILTVEANHSQTCRIKYEDLILNPVKALDPVFKFLGLDWTPSLLNRVFAVKHDPGGGDYKIEATHQIERDHIGRGTQIDAAFLALVPPDLRQRQKSLNQQLGYAD
jgi:protein-tyrosine sulfotransferase